MWDKIWRDMQAQWQPLQEIMSSPGMQQFSGFWTQQTQVMEKLGQQQINFMNDNMDRWTALQDTLKQKPEWSDWQTAQFEFVQDLQTRMGEHTVEMLKTLGEASNLDALKNAGEKGRTYNMPKAA